MRLHEGGDGNRQHYILSTEKSIVEVEHRHSA